MGLWRALPNKTQLRIGKSAVILAALAVGVFSVSRVASGLTDRSAIEPFANGAMTTGTVLSVSEADYKTGASYIAIITFTDSSGIQHTFTAPASPQPVYASEPAQVSYLPTDPLSAHDVTARPAWQAEVGQGSLGAVTATAILALGALRWRRSRSAVAGAEPESR
ncbi:hypothetical protein FHX52_1734 [Humibacillus xanthopallidus]|uniref:DUF3592 domain-containing protein n=1 Tax=Humibacillus xanthopallidus TaxID=412689 RepID=A0A543PX01_9MICO|nr:hypothetical protein [Humibacillus xanthopallidus]TQN48595.1 hypothetical protein FHX52_1734 [Humibacillus xanthopallidus]